LVNTPIPAVIQPVAAEQAVRDVDTVAGAALALALVKFVEVEIRREAQSSLINKPRRK
jgi:hypothetical protein